MYFRCLGIWSFKITPIEEKTVVQKTSHSCSDLQKPRRFTSCELQLGSELHSGLRSHITYWCRYTGFHQAHHSILGDFRALPASSCWPALWRCWLRFPAGPGTCLHCQKYRHLVQRPENWSDLNPGTNLRAIARRKRWDARPSDEKLRVTESSRSFQSSSAVPQTDLCHRSLISVAAVMPPLNIEGCMNNQYEFWILNFSKF